MKCTGPLISCVRFIGACSSGGSSGTSAPTGDSSSSANASSIARDLEASVGSVTKVIEVTEDNDPNDLIGRPNGYLSGAVIFDSGVDCGVDLGVDCGATIEVWPSADQAKSRSEYIQGLQRASPLLGSEYDYLDGAVLLRVTGDLKPTVAKKYEAAFLNG